MTELTLVKKSEDVYHVKHGRKIRAKIQKTGYGWMAYCKPFDTVKEAANWVVYCTEGMLNAMGGDHKVLIKGDFQ